MRKRVIEKRLPLKQFLLMFNTRNDIFQIEQLALFDDEALSYDVQVADGTFFADDFNVPIQTERTNIRRRSRRRTRISLPCPRENDNNSEANTEPELNDNNVTASTRERDPTGQEETSITVSSSPILENELSNLQDGALIYEVPDDDYGYWYSDDRNTSEELPFHTVNWDVQNSENVSVEKPSEDICTVCMTNARTHIFVPCGHLACCIECIERFEHKRCPVCNTTYETYVKVRKP